MITLTRVGNSVQIAIDGALVGTCRDMNAGSVQGAAARHALAVGLYFPHSFQRSGAALVSRHDVVEMYAFSHAVQRHLTAFPWLTDWALPL